MWNQLLGPLTGDILRQGVLTVPFTYGNFPARIVGEL